MISQVREHYLAVKSLVPSKWTVYQWNVPDAPTYPYVLLWGGIGNETTEALSDTPDTLELSVKATYAGTSGDSVMIVAQSVRGALNRARPAVDGWYVSRLHQSSLIDVQTDTDVTMPGTNRHPIFAVDEFALTSQRTT